MIAVLEKQISDRVVKKIQRAKHLLAQQHDLDIYEIQLLLDTDENMNESVYALNKITGNFIMNSKGKPVRYRIDDIINIKI